MLDYSITELTTKYKNGSLTPTQYIGYQVDRIENINPKINAIALNFNKSDILKFAEESSIRYKNNKSLGAFDGIPICIKDTGSSTTKGVELNKGSMISYLDCNNKLFGGIPSESVKEIAMLQESGAIILCLTTVPEMCWKGTCSSYLYGITRNPHNLTISTGGSSGGAAALSSLGIGSINIGSDSGGSIRIPSSYCGVFGYKPSYTISHSGNNGATFPYLSHCGPITRNIDDIIVYMQNICKYKNKLNYIDLSDKYIKNGIIKGMNIAISKNLDGIIDFIDDNVWKNVLNVAKYLEIMGANIQFVEPPISQTKMNYFQCVAKLSCITMTEYGEYIENFNDNKYKNFVDPGLLEIIERGKNIKNIKELIDIIQTRDEIKEIMNKFHSKYDLLITATCPLLPRKALTYTQDYKMKNMKTGKIEHIYDCYHTNHAFTCFANFTHQPALSMPSGYVDTEHGKMPIGVQIIGGFNKDNLVLKAAYCLQNKFKSLKAKL